MTKRYIDNRGWIYFVHPGLRYLYKTFYTKPGERSRLKAHTSLPWRDTSIAAQLDLDMLAVAKRWREVKRDDHER